jgi:D-3-phosphoglycerate dehydrogenase
MPVTTVVNLSPSFGTTSSDPITLIERAGAILLTVNPRDQPSDYESILAEATALIVGTTTIDGPMLARMPNLIIVAKHGAGVDNIDLVAASAAGVVVTDAAGTNASAVAELTLGLMIALARGIVRHDRAVRSGAWPLGVGRALENSTLGVLGMGRIGQIVSRLAGSFGMRVVFHDAFLKESPDPAWTSLSLSEVLSQADFLTIHVPLMDATKGLIDAAALAQMKPTAYLLNVARGGVVDESALAAAVRRGALAGAALDVFDIEPPNPDNPLLGLGDAVILSPHSGAYTELAITRTSLVTTQSVVTALGGVLPPNRLNSPDPWRGHR